MAGLAGEDFGDRDAFVLGLVRQHRAGDDVADGVDAGDVGLEMVIDDDAAALVLLDAERFEAEAFGVGHAADRDQHDIGLDRLRRAAPAAGSTFTLSIFPDVSTAVTFDDSLNVMPCFCSMRWNWLATSPSMPGRMRSRNSTIVTSAPSRRHTEPSSSPMMPAPTTSSFCGTVGKLERAGRRHDALLVDVDAAAAAPRRSRWR